MPRFAPLIKVSNCRQLGANVILEGDSFDEARTLAMQLAKEHGQIYISGYDDAAIIAGQGTIGLEILADVPDVDAIVIPVGGGGLIAGIGTAVRAEARHEDHRRRTARGADAARLAGSGGSHAH